MGDRGRTGAAARADEGDGAADERCLGIVEQGRDDLDQLQRLDRPDHVVRHALADQLAVQRDVVVRADDHDLGVDVADLGQLPQQVEQVAAAGGAFDEDQRRRRFVAVGIDRFVHAAALDHALGAAHAPVERAGVAGLQADFVVGKEMYGDARDRHHADIVVVHQAGRRGRLTQAQRRGEGLALHRRRQRLVIELVGGERVAFGRTGAKFRLGGKLVLVLAELGAIIGDELVVAVVEAVEGVVVLRLGWHEGGLTCREMGRVNLLDGVGNRALGLGIRLR